jgi:hypothetical protein
MTALSEIEARQIQDKTIRDVIARLTERATDPERIGRRVLVWKFQLHRTGESEKVIDLAKRLGVSQPCASQAIAEAQSNIHNLRNPGNLIPPSCPESPKVF